VTGHKPVIPASTMAGMFNPSRASSSRSAQGRFSSAVPNTNNPNAITPHPSTRAATESLSACSIR